MNFWKLHQAMAWKRRGPGISRSGESTQSGPCCWCVSYRAAAEALGCSALPKGGGGDSPVALRGETVHLPEREGAEHLEISRRPVSPF